MTLGPKPYYWPNYTDFGYSPPIATRAGYMAIAILPFQVMFATKWNPITILTGVSHERLQVYHRWSGWIMCAYTRPADLLRIVIRS
jgi:ferric-chelate reductase